MQCAQPGSAMVLPVCRGYEVNSCLPFSVKRVAGDITDDKFFRKANDSDCTQFHLLFPRLSAHFWACVWIMFEIGVCIAFLFLGIVSFKVPCAPYLLSSSDMNTQAGKDRFVTRHCIVANDCDKPFSSLHDACSREIAGIHDVTQNAIT
ncbi:hypothetical protein ID866_6572, partial [Astraeus odoratus]